MKLHQQTFIIQYHLEERADQATKLPEEEEEEKPNKKKHKQQKKTPCSLLEG